MSDLYQAVTDRIVAALEQGAPPWVRPGSQVTDAIPVNAQTRRHYRGVNFALLSLESDCHGYAVNRWLTYRQALELGAQVRKGEHGSTVVFWQLRRIAMSAENHPHPDDDLLELPEKVYPLLRAYTVFNVAQVDGLPSTYLAPSTAHWVPEAKGEELLLMSGARFRQGGARGVLPACDRRDPRPADVGVRQRCRLLQRPRYAARRSYPALRRSWC